MSFRGSLYIISAPSGAGKTSLVSALIETCAAYVFSVSHTTRQPRAGEIEGKHYHFCDLANFQAMIKDNAFLEYAKVFDHYYGTSKEAVKAARAKGLDVILEIDWQGAAQVRKQMPDAHSIFILPPSCETLKQRLQNRGKDTEEVIARRLREAKIEMSHYDEFDYLVVNDCFDTALGELQAIFSANRLRLDQQRENYQPLLKELLSNCTF